MALCIAITSLVVGVHGQPSRAARSTVVQKTVNGSFESPRLGAGVERYRPGGARWTFVGDAGLVADGSPMLRDVPGTPAGRQSAFIQNQGALQQTVSVAPGDVLVLRASQRLWSRTGTQRIAVSLDGRVVATFTPAERSWSRHDIPLTVSRRDVVTLELRGVYVGEGEDRTAFVDGVRVVRRVAAIPPAGLPAEERRVLLSPRTVPTAAGVIGSTAEGDSHTEINASVQAFAQSGDTIFVGGKFTKVEKGVFGARVTQRYLAAFDRRTGAWIDTFRPVLDGPVWDLATTPDGTLIVAGQFTRVNGVAGTRALAALDPATGAVVKGWRANLDLTGSTDRAEARTLDVEGDWVYVGGNFTEVGPDADPTNAGRLVRVSVDDGAVDRTFLPDIQDGTVNGVDATPTAVWVVGDFHGVGYRGRSYARLAAAKLRVSDAYPMPIQSFVPTIRVRAKQYAYSVKVIGNHVWVGGSQHMLQVYRASDFHLLRGWINFPIGDTQDLAVLDGVVYAGSHAGEISNVYQDVQVWDSVAGATRKDRNTWVGAFDDASVSYVTGWHPDVEVANGEGGWDLFVDSGNCLWAGGDFDAGSPVGGGRSYAAGFVRFCAQDSTAPATPTGARVTRAKAGGVRIAWNAVPGDGAGPSRYEVFRNDRLIRPTVTNTAVVDPGGRPGDRYFVRTRDAAGNRSATTPALVAP